MDTELLERIAAALERIADVAERREERKLSIARAKVRRKLARGSALMNEFDAASRRETAAAREALHRAQAGMED